MVGRVVGGYRMALWRGGGGAVDAWERWLDNLDGGRFIDCCEVRDFAVGACGRGWDTIDGVLYADDGMD